MAEVHTRRAVRACQLISDANGAVTWAPAPVTATQPRAEKLENPGPKAVAHLEGLPESVLMDILKEVVRYSTPLMPVSKTDAEGFRNAPAVMAQHDARNREIQRLIDSRHHTRGRRAKLDDLQDNQWMQQGKADDAALLLEIGYHFVDFPILRVNWWFRDLGELCFFGANQFTIRPTAQHRKRYNWYSDESFNFNTSFDEASSKILGGAKRMHVVLHWHLIPLLTHRLRDRAEYATPVQWLKLSLVGRLDHYYEAESYMRILRHIPVQRAVITWTPGLRAQRRNPPRPPAREVTWPALKRLFQDTELVMETGGVQDWEKVVDFYPLPLG